MERKEEMEQLMFEANRRKLEQLARLEDLKAQKREERRRAGRSARIAKGYETGV